MAYTKEHKRLLRELKEANKVYNILCVLGNVELFIEEAPICWCSDSQYLLTNNLPEPYLSQNLAHAQERVDEAKKDLDEYLESRKKSE